MSFTPDQRVAPYLAQAGVGKGIAMKVIHCEQVEAVPVESGRGGGLPDVLSDRPGRRRPSFSMRQFVLAPAAIRPSTAHAYEHEVYVLEGAAWWWKGEREHPLRPGSAVYVPPEPTPPVPQHRLGPAEVSVSDPASAARHARGLRGGVRMRWITVVRSGGLCFSQSGRLRPRSLG